MKSPKTISAFLCIVVFGLPVLQALALTNAWTSPSGGNWQDPNWSLASPPGPGQAVQIVNAGSKTVSISAATAQGSPQTLTVDSLALDAPAGDVNTLLMQQSGLETPLTANLLRIGSNAVLAMIGSALRVNGPNQSTFSIAGRFNQGGGSTVAGNQMDIGYTGPGVYTLTNGSLTANHLYLGGPFRGQVEQRDGSTKIGILHLGPTGSYLLRGGDYDGTVYFDGGLFRQEGGRFNHEINVFSGRFELAGGEFLGAMGVPDFNGTGEIVQTGGSNLAPKIRVGDYSDRGAGIYSFSNGVIRTPETAIRFNGTFNQWGGVHTVEGPLTIQGALINRGMVGAARYNLNGGELSASSINLLFGYYTQSGGTNSVGELTVAQSYESFFTLNGGTLRSGNVAIMSSSTGGILQTDGSHTISNTLSINGGTPLFRGYTISGGDLSVSNVVANAGAVFRLHGGRVTQSGLLTLNGGLIECRTTQPDLGQVQLGATDSAIRFGSEAAQIRFGRSSGISWPSLAALWVHNWSGSPNGGGYHQVRFGTNGSGLTAEQLKQIRFYDPIGFQPGTYEGRMLASGEIVPEGLPPVSRIRPLLYGSALDNGSFRVSIWGEAGAHYALETSTNLTTWTTWTNGVTPQSGWLVFDDNERLTIPNRVYRAVLLP